MFHLKAIELISKNLRAAYAEAKPGVPGAGREGMALGQYVAGMGFSNVGLGIDYAMAHTLSAHYDTPHGVACAMLLPVAMEFNKPVCAERLADVARVMGVDVSGMSVQEAADAAIDAVRKLPPTWKSRIRATAWSWRTSSSWRPTPWPTPASQVISGSRSRSGSRAIP